MSLIRPQADIPVVSVSINGRLDARAHFELGRALQPLRDDDTLIICSGQATHNLNAGFSSSEAPGWATEFVKWLDATVATSSSLSYSERRDVVERWQHIPSAKRAHPTPDRFTPFVAAIGAGMETARPAATKLSGGWAIGHMSFASYAWGVVDS
ncbi:hypothetical protein PybrP1_000074 [[Pythium] brassicae (nom. inval.)]|nr:hypothetical protein PybrP1_000074 [[Pythium] brassicae (nom. inval.)]